MWLFWDSIWTQASQYRGDPKEAFCIICIFSTSRKPEYTRHGLHCRETWLQRLCFIKLVLIEYHRVMGSRSNRQIIAEDECNSDATRSLHPSYHHISMSLSWPGNTNLERSWETFPASCKHPHTPPPCPCCLTKDEIRRCCWLLSAIIRTQIGIMLTSQTKISNRFYRRVNALSIFLIIKFKSISSEHG